MIYTEQRTKIRVAPSHSYTEVTTASYYHLLDTLYAKQDVREALPYSLLKDKSSVNQFIAPLFQVMSERISSEHKNVIQRT